ncbi:Twinfilin [Aphelenchoides besseyi]|nr:Twinfilin [Aphelenchoides besseyi]KAI6202302.1 Twinfilin [Aphelenchoides besseyi]
MACQTGIRADGELKKFFEDCKQNKVRLAKFVINKEKININHWTAPSKDWHEDWSKNLPKCVDSYEPCFILFRLDSMHDWVLISFADDKAPTRDKMLLAATKATFKTEFGPSFIRHDVQISNPQDLDLEKFRKRLEGPQIQSVQRTADSDLPYTHIERELSTVSKNKISLPQPRASSQALLRGVQFPVDQDAIALLKNFAKGELDFVQLSVDTLNEAIKLESHYNELAVDELNKKISRQKPRYTLYRFRDAEEQPVFFIYSVPPSVSCTIKELMLFSSCKAPFVHEVQKECGVKITKNIEVDSRDKLDGPTLLSYINPVKVEVNRPIVRPPRPGR